MADQKNDKSKPKSRQQAVRQANGKRPRNMREAIRQFNDGRREELSELRAERQAKKEKLPDEPMWVRATRKGFYGKGRNGSRRRLGDRFRLDSAREFEASWMVPAESSAPELEVDKPDDDVLEAREVRRRDAIAQSDELHRQRREAAAGGSEPPAAPPAGTTDAGDGSNPGDAVL